MTPRMNRRTFVSATAAAAAAPAVLKHAAAQDAVTIKYQLWDANQLPAYQACADKFTEENPNITVEIEQLGWDDYWTGIQTGMVAGSAPDVFTNHLAKYPEFAEKNQLVDIQSMVDADGVDVSIYEGELADLWSRDGKRFGLPKDWDTIAVVYNKEMLDAAGIDPATFEEWTWNPDDGGDFAEVIAKLSIDENGNDGTSPDFDASKVAQYGLALGVGDAYGQTGWSLFAASTGWRFIDEPWTPPFHFDDERVINSVQWLADQSLVNGFCVPQEQITSLQAETIFTASKAALVFHGSWMINWFADNTPFEFGFGRLPTGPEARICMFNGLADSIWTGSKHQDEAWQWVKYLGSAEAQEIVGSFGAVFPAIPSGAEAAEKAYADKGLDVSPYLQQAQQEGGTFLFPIADHASDYAAIVTPAMESVGLGQAPAADVLPDMNDEVNDLF
ncbi:MAG TPA: sugar ABC transporter substrate-binding protein [Thermomicrobiales bacterium]|nr:sugar ABC transporter substrate-binding protein [Thermomicrobiales bacterium]